MASPTQPNDTAPADNTAGRRAALVAVVANITLAAGLAAAAAVPHVRLIEKAHARKSGPRYFVDMHVHVDAGMSVAEAHKVSGMVKSQVRTDVPTVANVLVHIEPFEPAPPVT